MWFHIITTYFHFISIFILFSALIIEISIIKKKMIRNNFRLLKKADLVFGVSAILVVATGFLKLFYFGKGENYYLSNHIFLLKTSIFILIGLLSIYPTIQFIKLSKLKKEFIELRNFKTILFLLRTQLILLLIIPFLAVIVAKGITVY